MLSKKEQARRHPKGDAALLSEVIAEILVEGKLSANSVFAQQEYAAVRTRAQLDIRMEMFRNGGGFDGYDGTKPLQKLAIIKAVYDQRFRK